MWDGNSRRKDKFSFAAKALLATVQKTSDINNVNSISDGLIWFSLSFE
jgi:hypothetical protein